MLLAPNLHLAYCTNVHPGQDWAQTLDSLNRWTLPVKARVQKDGPYAIGLRLSALAARQLAAPGPLLEFQRWLDKHGCYVFTINGFPFGRFHGARVKERVYEPDWTTGERVEYTNRLVDLLAELVPPGVEGSVSTLPGSFKEFIRTPEQEQLMRANLWRCVEHIAGTCARTERQLHLGLEPEPLCFLENSVETARFFDQLREDRPGDERLEAHLGVNYDTCHFAIEFEEPQAALARLQEHRIRLSKIHISNALKLRPSGTALRQLAGFAEDTYLHQVIVRHDDGSLARFKDLDLALANFKARPDLAGAEWRIHFHIPLHCQPPEPFESTSDHIQALFELIQVQPRLCAHLEMETYTWAVLPDPLRSREVTDQIVAEYDWTLARLTEHGLVHSAKSSTGEADAGRR